jgi:putative (di)nucleoside polyphosphate hydrolase
MSDNNSGLPYRPCVGIALFNREGKVFVGERIDSPGAWQMPQGGIDSSENERQAAFRELGEETGTANAEIIRVHDQKLRYSIPEDILKKMNLWDGKYGGQEQTWVAMRFLGEDSEIDITRNDPQEFQDWQWAELDDLPDLIIHFKRDLYRQVIAAFRDIAIR